MQGNELGLVDYTYWAFKLYGISINALVLFYFTLLFVSIVLFFVTFRRSRFCLLLLMLYLAAHYFALDYAQTRAIVAMQNSRFFPVNRVAADRILSEELALVIHGQRPEGARRRDLVLGEVKDIALVAAEGLPIGVDQCGRIDRVLDHVGTKPRVGNAGPMQ